MKKALLIGAMAAAMLGAGMVQAEEAAYVPGVTVAEDAESPTGYTVTFVYEDAEAEQIQLRGAFTFYYDEPEVRGQTPETFYKPEEWQNGMFEAGDESLTIDMEKVEGTDLWVTSMPLPGGHYQYVFLKDGDADTKLEDPTNPMEASGVENGNHYDRSTFYVPYDAEKQSDSLDFSYMAPIEEAGKLDFLNYTDVNGNAAPLVVYTPYGYDPEGEPYKTVYLSHGGGGNEMDWVAGGSVDYIFDNMIAAGTTEPVVLVMMNNTAYEWNFEVIVNNLVDNIIPFVEENYNVSTEPADRAFTGLSMGGMTTTNVLFRVPDQFGYFGILSGADVAFDTTNVDWEAVKASKIMLGAGIYDFGLIFTLGEEGSEDTFSLTALKPVLDAQGVEYGWEEAYGSHDWNTWPQLIKIFAEEYLWK